MNIVCVTAICGGYDKLTSELPPDDGTKYICFTDTPEIQCSRWDVRPACKDFNGRWDGNVRNAKRHKLLIHEYVYCDFSLWIDGHATLSATPSNLVNKYLEGTDNEVILFEHWGRSCVYAEAEICQTLGLDMQETMMRQMSDYQADGYPRNNGLHAGGIILRRHTKHVQEFNEFWWNQVCQYSKRDQLSLDYTISKTGIKVGHFCSYHSPESFISHRHHGY